jgi:hypothetical protein
LRKALANIDRIAAGSFVGSGRPGTAAGASGLAA